MANYKFRSGLLVFVCFTLSVAPAIAKGPNSCSVFEVLAKRIELNPSQGQVKTDFVLEIDNAFIRDSLDPWLQTLLGSNTARISKNGEHLALVSQEMNGYLVRPKSDGTTEIIELDVPYPVRGMEFSTDGKQLAVYGEHPTRRYAQQTHVFDVTSLGIRNPTDAEVKERKGMFHRMTEEGLTQTPHSIFAARKKLVQSDWDSKVKEAIAELEQVFKRKQEQLRQQLDEKAGPAREALKRIYFKRKTAIRGGDSNSKEKDLFDLREKYNEQRKLILDKGKPELARLREELARQKQSLREKHDVDKKNALINLAHQIEVDLGQRPLQHLGAATREKALEELDANHELDTKGNIYKNKLAELTASYREKKKEINNHFDSLEQEATLKTPLINARVATAVAIHDGEHPAIGAVSFSHRTPNRNIATGTVSPSFDGRPIDSKIRFARADGQKSSIELDGINSTAMAQWGKRAAVGTSNGLIFLVDIKPGHRKFGEGENGLPHENDRTLVIAPGAKSRSKKDSGKEGSADVVTSVQFSNSGKYLVASAMKGQARVWDLSKKDEGVSLNLEGSTKVTSAGHSRTDKADIKSAKFAPKDKFVATATGKGNIRIYNPQTGELIHDLAPNKLTPYYAGLAREQNRVKKPGGKPKVVEAETKPLKVDILDFAISKNGDRIVAVYELGHLMVWDTNTGKLLYGMRKGTRFGNEARPFDSIDPDQLGQFREDLAELDPRTVKMLEENQRLREEELKAVGLKRKASKDDASELQVKDDASELQVKDDASELQVKDDASELQVPLAESSPEINYADTIRESDFEDFLRDEQPSVESGVLVGAP